MIMRILRSYQNLPKIFLTKTMLKPQIINQRLPKFIKTEIEEKLILREPQELDAPSFVDFLDQLIEEEAFLTTDHQTIEDETGYIKFMHDEINKKRGVHLVVVSGNRKVAGVDITNKGTKREHVGELQIYIDKDYRGIGLGHLLLNTVEDEVKKLGSIKIIMLEVFSNNEVAIKLYQKYGYKITGNQEKTVSYKNDLVGMIFMQKEL